MKDVPAPKDPLAAAKNRTWRELAALDAALERGDIDEAGWFAETRRVFTPAYLAGTNPRAQSGHGGDEARWRQARSLLCDAFDRDGSFLDVGCASGHLMETATTWAAERGVRIEPYGLDIAPELVALARSRLPAWHDRIFEGNALYWRPPRRFTYVRTGLEYVPPRRRRDLVARLLDEAVEHRLIVGPLNETRGSDETARELEALGFAVSDTAWRPYDDPRLVRRVVWITSAARASSS